MEQIFFARAATILGSYFASNASTHENPAEAKKLPPGTRDLVVDENYKVPSSPRTLISIDSMLLGFP